MSKIENLQADLFGAWEKFDFDPSHGRRHIELVLKYALYLNSIYGGDEEIVVSSAVLHDLGRSNRNLHGEASRNESVNLARNILREMGIDSQKIEGVDIAIYDHDNSNPARTLEGKILKDADFLAGLGVEGILRSIVWTIESGQTIEEFVHRVRVKMPQRVAALELPASQEMARELQRPIEKFLGVFAQT